MGTMKNHHDWYRDHEKDLDNFVHNHVYTNVSQMVNEVCSAYWQCLCNFSLDEEQVININQKVNESFMEDGAEPTYFEALQHFVVDDWFALKLEERGEIIDYDFLGLTIWGRATCGQAISLDYVVQSIYKELNKVPIEEEV